MGTLIANTGHPIFVDPPHCLEQTPCGRRFAGACRRTYDDALGPGDLALGSEGVVQPEWKIHENNLGSALKSARN